MATATLNAVVGGHGFYECPICTQDDAPGHQIRHDGDDQGNQSHLNHELIDKIHGVGHVDGPRGKEIDGVGRDIVQDHVDVVVGCSGRHVWKIGHFDPRAHFSYAS